MVGIWERLLGSSGPSPADNNKDPTVQVIPAPGQPSRSVESNDNFDSEAGPPPIAPVVPTSASRSPFRRSKKAQILFYDKNSRFYEFTNFSPHDISYEGKRYPTSEHLFQAFKFLDDHPRVAERIRNCGESSISAFDEAHRCQKWVRPDWKQVNVEKMEIALHHKFTQHPDLKGLLLGTGEAELINNSPRDYFWGIGADHSGSNEHGKALMRLRAKLREERDIPPTIPTSRKRSTTLPVLDLSSHLPTQPISDVHSEGHDNLYKIPIARKRSHTTPDPPPDVRTQSLPNVKRRPVSAVPVLGNGPPGPQVVPPQGSELCEFCQRRPKFQNHRYCGRTCANEANKTKMCSFCRSKPRLGTHHYCSRTCAVKASTVV